MIFGRPPYIKARGVRAHPGNIYTLAVSEDSKILASAGNEGTRVWDINTMTQMKRPSAASSRGATLSLLWVHQVDEPHDVLYCGTQNGYFFAWRQVDDESFEEPFVVQISKPGEICGLSFDTTNNRICFCTRNGIVQSWSILKDPTSGKWTAQTVFSQEYTNLCPQAIMFAAFNNTTQDRDIMVFGLFNSGPVCTLRGRTGEIVSQWSSGAQIGDAVVNWREGLLCIDDPAAGPSLFRLTDQTKVRLLEIPKEWPREWRARNVRFTEGGLVVVSGSDHGVVYVFETRSGNLLQKLDIGVSQWVQGVAVGEIDGVPAIFAASTRDERREEIVVWKRARNHSIGWNRVATLVKVLVVLGCVAFIYQNLRGWITHRNLTDVGAGPELKRGSEESVNLVTRDLLWGKDVIVL